MEDMSEFRTMNQSMNQVGIELLGQLKKTTTIRNVKLMVQDELRKVIITGVLNLPPINQAFAS